jgi:hypothetical protein
MVKGMASSEALPQEQDRIAPLRKRICPFDGLAAMTYIP